MKLSHLAGWVFSRSAWMWILSARVSVDSILNKPLPITDCCPPITPGCPPKTAPNKPLEERASCLAHIPPPILASDVSRTHADFLTNARVLAYPALQRLTSSAGGFSAPPCFHQPPSRHHTPSSSASTSPASTSVPDTGKTTIHTDTAGLSKQDLATKYEPPHQILVFNPCQISGPSIGCNPTVQFPASQNRKPA